MKFTLFLGAGASVPFGFSDTAHFKKILEKPLDQEPSNKMIAMLRKSGYGDIEGVLNAIEKLINLPSNPGHNLLTNTKKPTYRDIEGNSVSVEEFNQIVREFSYYKEVIYDAIYTIYSWNNTPHNDLTSCYRNVFDILQTSDDGIHICTTNYDQVMEHYIDYDHSGLTRIDGFVSDSSTRKLFFQPDVFSNTPQNKSSSNDKNCYLYKLHGSLNWVAYGDKIRQREEGEERVADGTNFVIYPTLSPKDNYHQHDPYATIWKKFEERINETDVFVVIGYSFRDSHINNKFKTFLRREKTKMFVISPNATNDTSAGLGNEEFTYSNFNFTDPKHAPWIDELQDLYNEYAYEDSIDLNDETFEKHLKSGLSEWSGTNIDTNVYNLIGKIEEVNESYILAIIPTIYRMFSR